MDVIAWQALAGWETPIIMQTIFLMPFMRNILLKMNINMKIKLKLNTTGSIITVVSGKSKLP